LSLGMMVTVRSTDDAHSPLFGVNMYVAVVWLLTAGVQAPFIPLVETVGNGGNAESSQYGPGLLKVGTRF
jgi:hypothetical protein